MINQEAQNKHNFLTWYQTASDENKELARSTNEELYEKLLKECAYEVEAINLRKSLSLPAHLIPQEINAESAENAKER